MTTAATTTIIPQLILILILKAESLNHHCWLEITVHWSPHSLILHTEQYRKDVWHSMDPDIHHPWRVMGPLCYQFCLSCNHSHLRFTLRLKTFPRGEGGELEYLEKTLDNMSDILWKAYSLHTYWYSKLLLFLHSINQLGYPKANRLARR